jgi:hypothetical protein
MPQIANAEIEIAILVHRARFENDDVDGVNETAVIVRNFAEVQGHVIAAAGIVFFAVVAGKVPAKQKK